MELAGLLSVRVETDIDPLEAGLKRAETRTQAYDRRLKQAVGSTDSLAGATGRAATASRGYATSATAAATATGGLGRAAKTALGPLRTLAAAMVGGLGIGAAIQAARGFSAAIAEVGTLLNDLDELEVITEQSREFARTFGGSAERQAQAFYQAISAGASNAAEATELLDVANRLAIGGLTSIEGAVSGVSSVMNAYGMSASEAINVSDALFVAMKGGQTTVGQLTSTLGRVTPIAAALGVSFGEVAAATSALTASGQSTAEAVTGLRGIMSSILRPTAQATELANKLGLEFNSAALKAQGFAGFMDSVVEATGGSQAQLAQLFGSIEGINAALSLTGPASEKFTNILGQMEERGGATAEAFERVSQSLNQRFAVVLGQLGDVLLSVGNIILAILVPALETVMTVISAVRVIFDAFGIDAQVLANIITGVGAAFLIAFGPQVIAQVKAMAVALGAQALGAMKTFTAAVVANTAAVLRWSAALLANPIGLIVVGVTTAIALMWRFRDSIGVVGEWLEWLAEKAQKVFDYVLEMFRRVQSLFSEMQESGSARAAESAGSGLNLNINGDEAADAINAAFSEGGDTASNALMEALNEGGSETAKELVNALKEGAGAAGAQLSHHITKGSTSVFDSIDKGSKEFGTTAYGSIDKGGKSAARSMNQSFDHGASVFKAAGMEFSREAVKLMESHVSRVGLLMRNMFRETINQTRAETLRIQAETRKTMAEAEAIRSGRGGGGFGSGGGGRSGQMSSPVMQSPMQRDLRPVQQSTNNSTNTTRTTTGPTVGDPIGVTVINVNDPQQMVNVIGTREGNQELTNYVAANAEEIRRILGVA